jgi:hypothetical protein|tara:strand:+ start:903 stop:1100 length:198 start_codon:yes stop_codon:yes gene_type:complete
MQQIEYKKYRIDYVYDCSEGYDEINYYNVWTPDGLDLAADQFATIEEAKLFIDNQIEYTERGKIT